MDPAAALANRVLEREAWARTQLAPHAGKAFTIAVGPIVAAQRIDASGLLESEPLAGNAPDLSLTISPIALPALLADPDRWDEFVESSGEPELEATLKDLAHTLPWFVEHAFARALGPIAGQRLADAGRALLAMPEYAAQRFGESFASYARDEASLVARGEELRAFERGVGEIAQRVDALSTRLDALARRMA